MRRTSHPAAIPTVDLFAGPGGLTLGLAKAGFNTVAAVEFDSDACKTFKGHHPDTELFDCDIADVDFRPFRDEARVVVGGPPCQPFSVGGKRLAESDPRNGFPQFLRAVREVEPEAVLIENVAGLAAGSKKSYLTWVVDQLEDLGYVVTWKVLNAADYGVPQIRRRLFIVGLRNGQAFEFPAPTHGQHAKRPWVPAGAVISKYKVIGTPNPSIVTYAKNPSLRPNPYHGQVYNGGGRPIDLSQPSPTILASAGGNKTPWVDTLGVVEEYHRHLVAGGKPRQGKVPGARRITVEEAALLQTFPRSIQFAGTRSSQYTQVGNAVPPRLATALGRKLASYL